jgi:hydroxymethylpyrimidine pyrophosphatase-like HAD family hydrolase
MNAYLFDVDGVLSDPKVKQVTEPELFDHIIARLQVGDYVCLNTGRSLAWVENRIIDPLLTKFTDISLLSNFMLVGEKGGSWLTFIQAGEKKHEIDPTITVPSFLKYEIRALVTETFAKSMFFDESKETMISIEMQDDFDLDAFHADQKRLNEVLEALLAKHDLSSTFKIDLTIIATDVENNHVGKALGADRFITFLKTHNQKPEKYFAFGDSKSDIEMADELARRGEKVEFVFVGDKEKMDGITRDYPIEIISGFSKGTLTYLQK